MNTKQFTTRLSLKDDDSAPQGSVQAFISIFDQLDSDGDVVLKSFFTDGQEIAMSSWGHSWDDLPPGKGVVRVTDEGALFDGHFFLSTPQGQAHYETVKALGNIQEWSFGFRVLDAEKGTKDGQTVRFLKQGEIYEGSPVLIGANRDTRTVAIKSVVVDPDFTFLDPHIKGAIAPKKTDTSGSAWDGPAQESNLPSERAALRAAFAWVDDGENPDAKASYRFIHHFVNSDGEVGAASTVACSTGIGVLNGGRGGSTIPGADRQGVYNHMARHLRDSGRPDDAIPPLKSHDEILTKQRRTLLQQVEETMDANADLIDRIKGLRDLRAKEGRVLSTANRDWLGQHADQLAEMAGHVRQVLTDTAPDPKKAYVPAPYSVEPDEIVQCPNCQRMNDTDAQYCDQCGYHLATGDYMPGAYDPEPDEIIRCPNCGLMNDTDATYCDQCGYNLTLADDEGKAAHTTDQKLTQRTRLELERLRAQRNRLSLT